MSAVLMLAAKDLLQRKKGMLLNIAIMAAIGLMTITGGAGSGVLGSLLPVLVMVTTMGILYDEERSHGLQFLRSLPLSPVTVVAGKFLAIVAYLAIYAAMGAALLAAGGRLSDLVWLQILLSGGAALLLGGAAGVAFYWYGYQAIRWLFTGLFLLVLSVTVFVPLTGGIGSGRVASILGHFVAWVTASPIHGGLLGVLGVLIVYLLLGWFAVRGLARREL